MIVSTIGALNSINRMNNTAYSAMALSDAYLGLVSFGAQNGINLQSLLSAEQGLIGGIHQNSISYKINSILLEVFKKLEDQNIGRSFSTFA